MTITIMNDTDEDIEIIQKESDELFLDLIKERPCLFDKRLPEHHDKIVLENALEEIAFILQDTVENCEKKWKQFQSAYQREKMLQEQETRSGAGISRRQKWPYYDKMRSLYSSNTHRHSYTNVNTVAGKKEYEVPLNYRKSKNKKSDNDVILSAFNSIQSQLTSAINLKKNNSTSTLKEQIKVAEKEYDCNTLVGMLIAARLNECSVSEAKKKEKTYNEMFN